MAIHIMLTVDLNGHVSSEARAKFYEVLQQHNLVRRKLTTVWTAKFKPAATKESAVEYVRKAVEAAAVASKVFDYEVAVMPSDVAPTEWRSSPSVQTILGGRGFGLGSYGIKTLLGG